MNEHILTDEEKKAKKASMQINLNQKSHIGHVIGITSGKGGVGKSTVTSLLATHLATKGYHVGIIDADLTGPSIPKGFNLHQRLSANKEGWIPEITSTGIKVVSINLMIENETDPVLWRGPLISNMVKKFYQEVIWGDIDFLLVDFPPGTSDVAITLFQSIPFLGVIIVTSPQDLVSMIIQKALHMAQKMQVPVLGLVENYSYFECPICHTKHEIFGKSNIEEIVRKNNIALLAKIPIDNQIATAFDQGNIEEISSKIIDEMVNEILQNLNLDLQKGI